LFDYFTKTKILDDSIVNSFYANYNYVAGAASAGFPPKKSSNCDGIVKYVAFNFCELLERTVVILMLFWQIYPR